MSLSQNFYLYIRKENPPALPIQINTTYTNRVLKASERDGVAAQGNENPRSAFAEHALMSYKKKNGGNVYLDPSYGIPISEFYTDFNEYESAAIAGFGSLFKYNRPAGDVDVIWIHKLNDSTQQLDKD